MKLDRMMRLFSKPLPSLMVIALAVLVIYGNVYRSPFVFDDESHISEEGAIGDWTRFASLKGLLKPRALVDLTFAANYRLGGMDVFGFHLVNVAIHILTGFLVYFLSLTIFRRVSSPPGEGNAPIQASSDPKIPSQGTIPVLSLYVALIFVTHPIQTQAVTYIIQRYTSMAAMFYLASVLCYVQGRLWAQGRADGGGWFSPRILSMYLLSAVCGVAGFLSKQNTASLPAAIMLSEYVLIDRTWAGWKRKLIWFALLVLGFGIFAAYVSGGVPGGHGFGSLLEDLADRTRETRDLSRWSYLCTQFNVLALYLRLLFLPTGQNLDYMYPFKSGFWDGYTPLAFLILAGLLAMGIWYLKRRPVIGFGILWFFITLSVESSILPISDALFEHRLYLPMFGFALILPYLAFYYLRQRPSWAVGLLVAVVLSLSTATYLRNEVWRDRVTLWSDVVSKNPENYRGLYNLGVARDAVGRHGEAAEYYSRAIGLKPEYVKAHNNLGLILAMEGRYEEAIGHYSEALRVRPDYAKAHDNLAVALTHQGKIKEAMGHLQEAMRLSPKDPKIRNNLAIALMRQGNLDEAIGHLQEALRIKPDDPESHNNLGMALAQKGRLDEATIYFSKALKGAPEDARIQTNLGRALMYQDRLDEASDHLSQAIRLKPDYAAPHVYLGRILARQGDVEGAIGHFTEAIRIAPQAELHNDLGIALATQGKYEEAIKHFSEALRLKPDYTLAKKNLEMALESRQKPE